MSSIVPTKWHTLDVEGVDIVGAARTLTHSCKFSLLGVGSTWQLSSTYIAWASADLMVKDARGWSNAVANAKRAVCRRIDTLLMCCNLDRFLSRTYPEKIDALRRVGVPAPNVVHELIIDPRNDLEHEYSVVDDERARHAVDIADLYEKATRPSYDDERFAFQRPLLFGDVRGYESGFVKKEGNFFRLTTPPGGPLLLVDCHANPAIVYVLDFGHAEARRSRLSAFSDNDAIDFANWCRRATSSHSASDIGLLQCIKAEFGL